MGDINSITKKVACPHCKNVIDVIGNSGETIEIKCSKCNTSGIFSFPKEKEEHKITDESNAIVVNNIEFTYPKSDKKAVNGVTFEISKGEIFGFLGPNGAGKTTTQKIIIGLFKQYSGNVLLLGKNLNEWKTEIYNRIGVGFELPNHYQKLTALENLELFASFYRGKTIPSMDLLKMVDLEKDANERVATFSKGMKSLIKNIILQKRKEGKAIFLTTHNMNDADELCDRVGFIVDGKIVLIESPKELKIRHGKKIVKIEYLKNDELLSQDFDLKNLVDNNNFLNLLKVGNIQTIHTAEATLDDIFIKATGRQLK